LTEENLNINSGDSELIAEFLNGSHAAFNLIVRKYQERIYRMVRKMVLNHDDADDITQEVFIKIYNSVKDFRGESQFFTYIYRIAVNFSLNHLNRHNKIRSRNVNIDDRDFDSKEMKADDIFDAKEKTKLLEEAIGSLPVQQRAVFNMRYYDNLSYEEISDILQKSTGGMKANYFHALKNIEKFISNSKMKEVISHNY
jgi:RNA polymerase sigma-70 factor (ECF subfamily)